MSRNKREGKFIGFKCRLVTKSGYAFTYYYRGHLGDVYRDYDIYIRSH